MSAEQVQVFLVFAVVAAITPGPSNVMLTATGANVGVLRGLPCLFGVGAGMGLMLFLVAYGLGSLVLDSPMVLGALNWCGAAFLLWLSWKIATAGKGGAAQGERKLRFRLSQPREYEEQDQSDDPEEQLRRLAQEGREEKGKPR